MKHSLKKVLLIGGTILVPVTIIGTSTAAYFSTSKTERISEKGIYQLRVNENLNNEGYKYDLSATYGSPTATGRLTYLINNEILHLETSGRFEYQQEKVDENGEVIEEGKVISPSYEAYKFANADAIVLTFIKTSVTREQFEDKNFFANNTDKYFQLVFNSDDSEIIPENSSSEKQDIIITKESKNPRSINNQKVFWKILNEGFLASEPNLDDENVVPQIGNNFVLAGMGVTFPGAKWVDSNGKETEYEIKARDMFYSAKRTWLYDKDYRRNHGGSQELDSYFIKKTGTISRLGESMKYPNEYLFDFFGVKKDWLYIEDRAIQKVYKKGEVIDEAYTMTFDVFNTSGNVNESFSSSGGDIIKKYLVNSLHFSLAPSDYIDEHANIEVNNSTPSGEIEGEAAQYGIYTYGQTRETTLFASQYVPISSKSGREIFEYNKYFANKKWVDSVEKGTKDKSGNVVKNLNKVIVEYSGGIDSSTFINQSFSAFKNGTLSELDFALLSDSQKQLLYGNVSNVDDATANAKQNGLGVTKKVNISQLTTRVVWQSSPGVNQPGTYLFNDVYSQLMYGAKKDALGSGSAITSTSFFANYGFKFRLLIQASINWQQFIQWAYSGTRDVWLSGAAQDAKFSSTNEASMNPHQFNEKGVNDLFFFDEKGNVETVTLVEMKRLSNMTIQEIKDEWPELGDDFSLEEVKLKSSSPVMFKKLQASMKSLIDDFYKTYNISSNEKIEFEIAYPFSDQDETKCLATEAVVNVINQLDNRINAKFFKPLTREEMLSSINQRKGAFNANLWGYDYEGIGSFVSAFASAGGGTNISPALSIFSKDIEKDDNKLFEPVKDFKRATKEMVAKLQKQFPKFTELAKYTREKINGILIDKGYDSRKDNGKMFVENWDLFTNHEIRDINSIFNQDNVQIIDPVATLAATFKAFESDAKWESLSTEEEKGQGWADLIKELNHIKGVSIDTESSVAKLNNVNYSLFLKEYIVPVSKMGYNQFADIKCVEK